MFYLIYFISLYGTYFINIKNILIDFQLKFTIIIKNVNNNCCNRYRVQYAYLFFYICDYTNSVRLFLNE